MELLERLIEEARLHGRVGLERDNALAALEKAGNALFLSNAEMHSAVENIERINLTAKGLRDELHESRNREQACLVALGETSAAIDKFVRAGRRKRGKPYDALLAAKTAADKLQDPIPF